MSLAGKLSLIEKAYFVFSKKDCFVNTSGLEGIEFVFRTGERYVLDGWWTGPIFCTKMSYLRQITPAVGRSSKTFEELLEIANKDDRRQFKIKVKPESDTTGG